MNHKKLSLIVAVLTLCGVVTFLSLAARPHIAMAEPSPTGATIASDYPDYVPGAIVTLTGAGWQPGEAVHIFVNDDDGRTWSHDSDPDPTADESGGFTYRFRLPTWFVANYTVTASGPLSGTATTTFTDLSIGTYDQCSNDDGDGYASGDIGCRWINGNLQNNNSLYYEGDATVQRVWLTGFVPGTSHTVTLKYGTTKGGKHAYDFLTTWDWSEDWIKGADRCQGIPGCETESETKLDIPQDPNVPDTFEPSAPGARQFAMRGGTLTSATTPAIDSITSNGDTETAITISFTVASSGDMCPTSEPEAGTCGVVLWFGAHVAAQANWGLGMGAGNISGSPYHVALAAVDGASVGQRDNQMQANVITYIPNGTIVIIKEAVPSDPQDFSFNLNNNSTISQDFSLDDDADATLPDSQTFSVPPGMWDVQETSVMDGWTLTDLVCIDPSNNTTVDLSTTKATINLASNETVTCTYTNTKAGRIIVQKVTSGGDSSFEFDPSWTDDFFLSNGEFHDSGPLPAGSYSVAEVNLPTTWSLTSAACDDGSPVDAISLQEGETVTCTFNNLRVYNQDLTVTKTATAAFNREYKWLIDKSVDDSRIEMAEGGTATFNYGVKVSPNGFTDRDWTVSGKVTVSNPNTFDVSGVNVTDAIDNGGECLVSGGNGVTVPAGSQLVLNYRCSYATDPNPVAGANTATATWDATAYNTKNGSTSGTAGVDFSNITPSESNKIITIVDDKADPITLGTRDWEDGEYTFTYQFDTQGVAGECTDYTNTAVIDETDQSASQTVTVCVGVNLTVSKTAAGTFDRTYKWLIDKSVDDNRIEIADGSTATFNYSVEVTPDGYTDSGWTLGGTITIVNPNNWEDITVDVNDTLDQGGTCSITETTLNVVVPRNSSVTLPYTCMTDGTSTYNTATVTWDKAIYFTPGDTATAQAGISFALDLETNRTVTVVDDQTDPANTVTLGTSDYYAGPFNFPYSLDKQGVAGTCTEYANTAVISETKQSDSQTVTVCVGKDLTVSKTVVPTFTRTWDWTIAKEADAAYDLFAGESVTHGYTVTITPVSTDSLWKVTGTITISNPNGWEGIQAGVMDTVNNGGTCEVAQTLVYVPSNSSVDVDYTCTWASTPSSYTGLNTAAVSWNKDAHFTPNGAASSTQSFEFTNPTEINPTITVDDDNLTGEAWSADRAAGEWTYSRDFACSANPADYTGGMYSYSHTNTAAITETKQSDTATVDVTCYAPRVTKTAETYWNRDWDWTITKDFDGSYNLFAGDTITHNYLVTVTPTSTDNLWGVQGSITVYNYHPTADMTLTSLTDLAGGVNAPVTCDSLVVPANGSLTCSYDTGPQDMPNANPFGDTNTATAVFAEANWTGSAAIVFSTDPTTEAEPVIIVDDDSLTGESWSADRAAGEWTYSRDFACSTDPIDYIEGVYSFYHTNTAAITETGQSDTATVDVTCYAPHVTKTAETYWNRDWDWTIIKDYDGSYDLFAGDTITHGYKVMVDPTFTDNLWGVQGSITVYNYHPTADMTLTSLTDLAGGIDAPVTCDSLVVPANGSLTCSYDTGEQNSPDENPFGDLNTATTVFAGTNWTGAAPIIFSTTPSTEDQPVITVDDSNGESWSANRAALELSYTRGFACSADPADYTGGKYSYSHTNIAAITETGQSDTATVDVTCYAPHVTKTAETYWNRDWDWTITKEADATYDLFAGDTITHNYLVTVTPTSTDNLWGVQGSITVYNYHPTADMTLTSLTDLAGGIDAPVICDSLVVPANGSLTCSYDTGPQDSPGTNPFGDTNTATAVFAEANWTGSAAIVFSTDPTTEDEPVITVDDDSLTGESWSADRAAGEWMYPRDFACSTNPADYTDGVYIFSHTNTAMITETEQSYTATVDVTCYWPQIELTKTGDELSKAGDKVFYDITLFNNTPADMGLRDLSCTISDPIVPYNNTVDLASGDVFANPGIEFTIPDNASDPFVNTAWVSCQPVAATQPVVGDSTFFVNDRASWSTELFQPAIEIVKTGPAYAYYGQTITYAFTMTNQGSSDTPSLVFGEDGYVTDDLLGDLTAVATVAGCDGLGYAESCTFTVDYTIPDQSYEPRAITNEVSVLVHPDGFPNEVTDTDSHAVNVVPPSQATNSSLCIFDRDPERDGQQFRLLFNQDPLLWPSYRINATNPGQFFYNVFATGTPGETLTFTITLPYPFVTQGANPLHGYAGISTYTNDLGQTCFMPGEEFFVGSQQVILSDYTNGAYEDQSGGEAGDGGDSLGTYSFDVTVAVPASGFVYVNLHLDYGLKGSAGYGKAGYGDAVDFRSTFNPPLIVLVPQLADHIFSVSGAQNDASMVENWNEFKKNPGVGGFSRLVDINGEPVVGATITLTRESTVVGTATTDEDGWYMIYYKHTGKPTIFTITLSDVEGKPDNFTMPEFRTLKANAFIQVDFFVPWP